PILTVIGHPITINATDVDQKIGIGDYWFESSFIGWTDNGTTRTFNLVADTQLGYGLWAYHTFYANQFVSFEVQPTGVVTYDNSHIGIIEGNETSTVKVIGHLVTINATDVDQKVGLGNYWYENSFIGWIEPGTTRTFNLIVNRLKKYELWAYYTHRFASFEVQPTGVITYDNSHIGIIEGNETSTVKVIGYPVTINATDVDQKIGLGEYWYTYSFIGWTEAGTTRTFNLIVNGQKKYELWAYYTHRFASFEVQPTGVVTYDNSHIDIIEGNETSTVKVIGHPV
ncbi:unnamed protein product, partial [marine sediment metagenome]